MAGYSGTSLSRKLGIKSGAIVALVRAPQDFEDELVPLPQGVRLIEEPLSRTDVIVAFCRWQTDLIDTLQRFPELLNPAAGLWIAWPKRAAGIATDVTESAVREQGLATGLVDNKVCAITGVWSGLRFVV